MLLQHKWILFLAFPLTWSISSISHVYGLFNLQGQEKDAWPELLHATSNNALLTLMNNGLVENVYVQAPSSGMPPTIPGTSKDVWLYIDDDNGAIYEIPKRGMWHPNRLSPGWPNLVGMDYKAAINKIVQDYLGATVIYGPKDYMEIEDFQPDRIWLHVNPSGMIAGVPAIG